MAFVLRQEILSDLLLQVNGKQQPNSCPAIKTEKAPICICYLLIVEERKPAAASVASHRIAGRSRWKA